MSKGLVLSSHCWPEGAIISACAAIYFVIATILLIAIFIHGKTNQKGCASQAIKENEDSQEVENVRDILIQVFAPTRLGD